MKAANLTQVISTLESSIVSLEAKLHKNIDFGPRLTSEWEDEFRGAVARGRAAISHHGAMGSRHRDLDRDSRLGVTSPGQTLTEGHVVDALADAVETLETLQSEVREYVFQVTDAFKECAEVLHSQKGALRHFRELAHDLRKEEGYVSEEILLLKQENDQLKDDLFQLDAQNHKLTKTRDEYCRLVTSHEVVHREAHHLKHQVRDLDEDNHRLNQDYESAIREIAELKTTLENKVRLEAEQSTRALLEIELAKNEIRQVQ
jgi:chromosome segregation ATPase